MKNKKAFTLIELLVVISIIALLMSIMMPSLKRAREASKNVVCLSNLKQWSLVWGMYTDDNNGRYHEGRFSGKEKPWITVLESYYQDAKVMVCPSASKPINSDVIVGSGETVLGDKNHAWGMFPGTSGNNWDVKGAYGSYGINSWICNPPKDTVPYGGSGMYWRKRDMRNAANVPVMGGNWFIGGRPLETNSPPEYDGHKNSGSEFEMGRFCLDRHDENIDMLFADGSARKVGLKELWRLKWHPGYNTNVRMPNWSREAPWMENFKDY
ncbi:MAG: type II secretion system protein [Sedimentisphaeraceae bacterium JB056]